MKINIQISPVTSPEPKQYTYDEISFRAGVYKRVGISSGRIIVFVKGDYASDIFVTPNGAVEPLLENSWRSAKFEEVTGETITLTIET